MDLERLALDPALAPAAENGYLRVPGKALEALAQAAFERMAFTFTKEHLENLLRVASDETNSANDRMVAASMLDNAIIASEGELPLCQDTGTAQVFAWKDEGVRTDGDDASILASGAEAAYRERNLRYSTTVPSGLFAERDPGDNMPAQVLLQATPGVEATGDPAGASYRFLFCAKGGGSSNKTKLFQATKALLNEAAFEAFLAREIAALGSSACPPYSIAVVVGGISPEQNLLALKLATAGLFDSEAPSRDLAVMGTLPVRVPEWEEKALRIARETGLGAQFGGKALATGATVLRLPRHGASCPVSIGVSCTAHRNLFARIDSGGAWLERTVADPTSIPGLAAVAASGTATAPQAAPVEIDLDLGLGPAREKLSGARPGTPVLLSGTLLVARDAAHAKWKALLDRGQPLPGYASKYAILYAGPAKTPKGGITGSFGPTTAGRMDEYAEPLMERGAALVTLAKGNRSEAWARACAKFGAFYLGTMGGTAALIAKRHVEKVETIDYPELGMEAVRLVTVKELPAFVLVNDRGDDFYRDLAGVPEGKKG